MSVTIEKWISYEESEGKPECLGGLGGFFDFGMRWKDYCEDDPGEHLTALHNEIIRLGIREGGNWHQEDPHGVPLFSDGTVATYSYRGWGDLLAAIWSQHDDLDYCYMDFYMSGCDGCISMLDAKIRQESGGVQEIKRWREEIKRRREELRKDPQGTINKLLGEQP